jgi:hypothetical protein
MLFQISVLFNPIVVGTMKQDAIRLVTFMLDKVSPRAGDNAQRPRRDMSDLAGGGHHTYDTPD